MLRMMRSPKIPLSYKVDSFTLLSDAKVMFFISLASLALHFFHSFQSVSFFFFNMLSYLTLILEIFVSLLLWQR